MSGISRRTMLAAGLGTAVGLGLLRGTGPAAAAPAAPPIRPRTDWSAGRTPTGSLAVEDVRFLIIHHSASPNTETPGSIPGRLRSFFDYHTTAKGWPDVAYNFFVDPFGQIWEGRTGSLAGPVRGDATAGSQGFAQLCCFVGDHTAQPPTEAAMAAMTMLVAWLAGQHEIDLAAGHAIEFTSRGSNRWPAGTKVITDPVVGHRDMSQTSCPGDALYPLVRSRILPGALALSGSGQPDPFATAVADTPPPAAEPIAPAPTGTAAAGPVAPRDEEPSPPERLEDLVVPVAVGAGVLGVGAIAGGVISARRARPHNS